MKNAEHGHLEMKRKMNRMKKKKKKIADFDERVKALHEKENHKASDNGTVVIYIYIYIYLLRPLALFALVQIRSDHWLITSRRRGDVRGLLG
jgi:hypothetical protein